MSMTLFSIFIHSLMHILHVPNHNERTTEFHVESDLTCISGPPSISITGGDLVDYPLLIKPIRRGLLSGVVAFVAQAPATTDRCTYTHTHTHTRARACMHVLCTYKCTVYISTIHKYQSIIRTCNNEDFIEV